LNNHEAFGTAERKCYNITTHWTRRADSNLLMMFPSALGEGFMRRAGQFGRYVSASHSPNEVFPRASVVWLGR
jgi:hypothetical protein